MKYDRRGLALTTDSTVAAEHLGDAVYGLLRHRADVADHLRHALAADDGFAAAHCLAGFALLLLGRSELLLDARRHAESARRSLVERGGTLRERLLQRALAAWCDGEMEHCAGLLERALAAEPLDAMTFKLAHAVRFMLGDSVGMRLAAERILPAWTHGVAERGFVLGCYAFALEETDDLDAAERIGRQAVALEPEDAWGCHAVAHVFEASGRAAEGIRWLARHEDRLAGVNNFACHLFWHRALFHLARNELDAAMALFDGRIRAKRTDDYRDLANAASLLWRLEREGVDVGHRWDELADIAERRIDDRALVFAQLHYMICLAAAGRWESAVEMIAAMDVGASEGWGTQARLLAAVGLPLAKAIFAVSIGDAGRALDLMLPRHAEWPRFGGSRTQRDLFRRLLIEAAAASRRLDKVAHLLDASAPWQPLPARQRGVALPPHGRAA
jgi:tetratricopeptide (TPR) repeat protein